jgi:hypothetical protein
MASIIARSDGRYEIRESVSSGRGPTSRTLAIFRRLSDAQLDLAQGRATRPFDREALVRRARELGVPLDPGPSALAFELLRMLRHGGVLPRAVAGALRDELEPGVPPDSIPPMLDWIGATAEQRGEALRQLLRFTDRIDSGRRRRRTTLAYPRVASA